MPPGQVDWRGRGMWQGEEATPSPNSSRPTGLAWHGPAPPMPILHSYLWVVKWEGRQQLL